MSATFSSPGSATSGLQPYHLEPGTKNLYPAPHVRGASRLHTRKRLRGDRARNLGKGEEMTNGALTKMRDMLLTSVTGIVESTAADKPALLRKSFDEYGTALDEALAEQMEEAHARGAEEASDGNPYAELGAVGSVAHMVEKVGEHAAALRAAYSDHPEMLAYLDGLEAMGDLALRTAVNEHVELATDDEIADPDRLPEGMNIVMVPSAEAPDDERMAVALKTVLPAELAKFAMDPAIVIQAALEVGTDLLIKAGVPEGALMKAFQTGALRKDGGNPNEEPEDAGVDAGAGDNQSPMDDQGADQGGQDPMGDALNVLGRLAAALMIQIDHVQSMYEGDTGGDDEEGAGDEDVAGQEEAGGETGGDAAEGEGDPAQSGDAPDTSPQAGDEDKKPAFGKATGRGALNKVTRADPRDAKIASLEKGMGELTDMIKRALAQPVPVKGAVMEVVSMAKSSDTTGATPQPTPAERQAQMDSMTSEQRLSKAMKDALANPQAVTAGDMPGILAKGR